MELSIIVLNYKTKDLTISCINSIAEQYKKELDEDKFEIVVLDNNSNDDSFEVISKLTKSISNLRVYENEENLGFSKGSNLCASKAKGEYLLFLNSDTEIKDQGFLRMTKYLSENKNVGVLGGKLKNADGSSQLSTGKFYSIFNLFLVLLGLDSHFGLRQSPNTIKKVDWVSGGCLMIKKDIFEKIKGFEKDFFMYLEDMELCFRVKKKGFDIYFYPEVMLYHKELGSSNRTFAIVKIYAGILIFYKKHKSSFEYLLVKLMLKSKALVLVILGKIINNQYLKDTYLQALKI